MKTLYLSILLMISLLTSALADTEDSINLELTVSHDDNLNRSQSEDSALDDTSYSFSTGFTRSQKLDRASYTDYRAFISYQQLQDYDGPNNVNAGISMLYNIKPSNHFTSPTYSLGAEVSVADFEADVRDRTTVRGRAMISFWATHLLSLRTGLSFTSHDSDSRVYDSSRYRLFLNADYLLGSHTLYSTLSLITGDIISTVPVDDSSSEILDVIRQADDIEFDPSFADNMLAYRIDSDIASFVLGYNHLLGAGQSIDISVRHAIGKADFDVDYESTSITLSYLASFGL